MRKRSAERNQPTPATPIRVPSGSLKKHGVELPIEQVREHRESRLSCRQSGDEAPQIRVLQAVGVAVRVRVGAAKEAGDPVRGVGNV